MNQLLVAPMEHTCPGCGSPSTFVTPECADHGEACPELACVLCGWAMVLADDATATVELGGHAVG
jgi:hypothetical protein